MNFIRCRVLLGVIVMVAAFCVTLAGGQAQEQSDQREGVVELRVSTDKVFVTTALPGKEAKNLADAFETKTVTAEGGKVRLRLSQTPLVVEEQVAPATGQLRTDSRFGAQAVVERAARGRELPRPDEFARTQQGIFSTVSAMGVGWARGLQYCEPLRFRMERGNRFDFSNPDAVIGLAGAAGLRVIARLLPRRTPSALGLDDEDEEGMARYVRAVVERYDGDADLGLPEDDPAYPPCDFDGDGKRTAEEKRRWAESHRVAIWEVLKEPTSVRGQFGRDAGLMPADCARYVRLCAKTAKAANPEVRILFGGIGPMPGGYEAGLRYFDEMLRAGAGDFYDIIGVDAFTQPVEKVVSDYRRVLNKHNLKQPIWVLQTGASSEHNRHNPWGGTPERQAEYVVKGFVTAFAAGAEKVFWGDTVDNRRAAQPAPDPLGFESFGLFYSSTLEKKPGYYTYALVAAKLDGFESVEKIAEGQFKFTFKDRKPVYVLWAEGERRKQVADAPTPGSGALALYPPQPGYFRDSSGKPIVLIGDYTWGTFSDVDYDYKAMFDTLKANGLNFARVWVWWGCEEFPEPINRLHVNPYLRTGPGNAHDGKPKYDLTKFNPAFFERLRAVCVAARERGIFLQLTLFDAWMIKHAHLWQTHAYHRDNNIVGVDGDLRNTGTGADGQQGFCSPGNAKALEAQKAFIGKVVDAVNEFDNVFFEIANENYYNAEWERQLCEFIHNYEKSKPKQHLVMPLDLPNHDCGGIKTYDVGRLHANLLKARSLKQPLIFDTDGIGNPDDATVRKAAWTAFVSGGHVSYLDDSLQIGSEHKGDVKGSRRVVLRQQLGYLATFSRQVRFYEMQPTTELVKAGNAFAFAWVNEIVAYLPNGGGVTLDLSNVKGVLTARWFNPRTGKFHEGAGVSAIPFKVEGGGRRDFTAPDDNDWALYMR